MDKLSTNDTDQRKKSPLAKGFSLMDWIRFMKSLPIPRDRFTRIIYEDELAKHNRENDCWTVLNDKVYDITTYMKYHPGGIDELMRCAGIVGTQLFNDVHPWVNFQSMLENCLIGKYGGSQMPKIQSTTNIKPSTETSLAVPIIQVKPKDLTPKMDYYQNNDKIILAFYIKWNLMNKKQIIIDKANDESLIIDLYLKDATYEYKIELNGKIKENYESKLAIIY